jgi:hypothetical protein
MSELTVLVELGGRKVEMRKPTDGALVVLARTFRGMPKIENVDELKDLPDKERDRLVRNLGTLGKIVEEMIVKDADKEWLDDAMIEGAVSAEDVFGVIKTAGEKFNGGAQAVAKKAAPVRRRR